jgi:hypothetical protein
LIPGLVICRFSAKVFVGMIVRAVGGLKDIEVAAVALLN